MGDVVPFRRKQVGLESTGDARVAVFTDDDRSLVIVAIGPLDEDGEAEPYIIAMSADMAVELAEAMVSTAKSLVMS